uniref:Uncharacterized protein n=1 Tax=Ralstonia solanacearum TaxID=305 RepID=A0A0S4TX09_RALSL|nr:protein of unknown function [Ralstonia solanacearum]
MDASTKYLSEYVDGHADTMYKPVRHQSTDTANRTWPGTAFKFNSTHSNAPATPPRPCRALIPA